MSALDEITNPQNWELERNRSVFEAQYIFVADARPQDAFDELMKLRAENEQKDKAFQLSVAECVMACNERDMHRRNWEKTMEHRDRLSTELEEALTILKRLAYKKNVEDVDYFDLVAVTHFVEDHTEPMR